MEINNNQNIILSNHLAARKNDEGICQSTNYTAPVFKGGLDTFLNKSGSIMNKIENGGFLVLFLIQDFLGMTVPRTIAGFLRDKEETGEYNIQEGFEVLGREGLTGPCMMSVAPLSLLLASKTLGDSTSINTELIKRYGDSLKEILSAENFDKSLLKDGSKFKTEFYKKNIENILKQTLGDGVNKEELNASVDYIMKQLENYENIPKDAKLKKFMGKSRYRSECLSNISSYINNLKYKTSTDLDMLNKVKLSTIGAENSKAW